MQSLVRFPERLGIGRNAPQSCVQMYVYQQTKIQSALVKPGYGNPQGRGPSTPRRARRPGRSRNPGGRSRASAASAPPGSACAYLRGPAGKWRRYGRFDAAGWPPLSGSINRRSTRWYRVLPSKPSTCLARITTPHARETFSPFAMRCSARTMTVVQ